MVSPISNEFEITSQILRYLLHHHSCSRKKSDYLTLYVIWKEDSQIKQTHFSSLAPNDRIPMDILNVGLQPKFSAQSEKTTVLGRTSILLR